MFCSCKCESCYKGPQLPQHWDSEGLDASYDMLTEDFDFAPELDELLKDPMLGDATGFERFLDSPEAAEAAPCTSDSAGHSANIANERVSQTDHLSSASTQTPAQRPEQTSNLSSSTPGNHPKDSKCFLDIQQGHSLEGGTAIQACKMVMLQNTSLHSIKASWTLLKCSIIESKTLCR